MVGVGGLALAADLWPIGIEPITILTLALVAVTGFYAIQNWRMAELMQAQLTAARDADRARQSEVQIRNTDPLLLEAPILGRDRVAAMVAVRSRSTPLLKVTVTLRARMQVPDSNSTDGRSATIQDLGSFPPNTSREAARFTIGPYLTDGQSRAYEQTWQIEVSYHGLFGQWVVETYEWGILDALADRPALWGLRRLQIQPNVEGAKALDQWFDVN
jgi:hypothetical protein